jgi:hypothetical protein
LKLDVGVLQHLLEAVGDRGAVADQLGPLPGQVAQFADRPRRDEAGRQQAVLQKLGYPLGVLDVGLPPRHLLDVPGIDQQQLEAAFQEVIDRLPIDPGRFHRHMGHPLGGQPVGQVQQLGRRGAEASHVLIHPALGVDPPDAGHDGLLVYI